MSFMLGVSVTLFDLLRYFIGGALSLIWSPSCQRSTAGIPQFSLEKQSVNHRQEARAASTSARYRRDSVGILAAMPCSAASARCSSICATSGPSRGLLA